MDGTTIIVCFSIAMFCFTFVYWMKKSENKYRFKKTQMVDIFIKKRNISVHNFYSGFQFDLVNDAENRQIWFFVLQHNTLQYKNIPYEELFQVAYKLDDETIKAVSRSGPLKRELVGAEVKKSIKTISPKWQKEEDVQIVKEVRLTVMIDDLQATTLDLVFHSTHLPVELKRLKDAEAKEWFDIFTFIIENEERKQA